MYLLNLYCFHCLIYLYSFWPHDPSFNQLPAFLWIFDLLERVGSFRVTSFAATIDLFAVGKLCLIFIANSLLFFYQFEGRNRLFIYEICFFTISAFSAHFCIDFRPSFYSFLIIARFISFSIAFIYCLYMFAILPSCAKVKFCYFYPRMNYVNHSLLF